MDSTQAEFYKAHIIRQWAALFSREDSREPGYDTYDDIFNSPCFPLQRRREMARMMQVARGINPRVVYDIGGAKGGGLYHWCKCLPSVERIAACEITGMPYRFLFEKAFPAIDFLWLDGKSYDPQIRQKLATWLATDTIDILFLDGHKLTFLLDFANQLPLMSSQGIVFMHDLEGSSSDAFQTIVNDGYRTDSIIDTSEDAEAVERMRQDIPSKNSYEGWMRYWKGQNAGVGVIYPHSNKGTS